MERADNMKRPATCARARVSLAIRRDHVARAASGGADPGKMTHVGLDVHKDTIAIAKLRPKSDATLVWLGRQSPPDFSRTSRRLCWQLPEQTLGSRRPHARTTPWRVLLP